jgi:hypothetical protein
MGPMIQKHSQGCPVGVGMDLLQSTVVSIGRSTGFYWTVHSFTGYLLMGATIKNIGFYNCAYLSYNISMVVKRKVDPIGIIRNILKDQNGILLTSDLGKYGIQRTYLSILEKKGEIQRISRGVYSAGGTIIDEMAGIQARYKGAIFSHETAAYLLGLTDRTPLFYSVTVPAGYNATSLKAGGAKVFYINRGLHPLGLITVKSPHGNDIKTFNPERTICDLLRSRNQIDVQQVNEPVKRYVGGKNRNIDLLYYYARQFGIQKIIREYIEVLL